MQQYTSSVRSNQIKAEEAKCEQIYVVLKTSLDLL